MSHKADRTFFKNKRPWSERKDIILSYYLTPYLPKMSKQGPVVIVDGFAGPGQFDDGELGSPLLIAKAVHKHNESIGHNRASARASALFIESDPVLHEKLARRINGFGFVETMNCGFLDSIDRIVECAKTNHVFLYLDPFTVSGIDSSALFRIFDFLKAGQSIELLFNFNVNSLGRRACAAMALDPPPEHGAPADECEPRSTPSIDALNKIVGGEWWKSIISENIPYSDRIAKIRGHYCRILSSRFAEVCFQDIFEHYSHVVPKYVLIFASRHPDAFLLMNDAMCKSREKFEEATRPSCPELFESRPETVVPNLEKLPSLVRETLNEPMTRREVVLSVVRGSFCTYSTSEIKKCISQQIKAGALKSSTGRARINDKVVLTRSS